MKETIKRVQTKIDFIFKDGSTYTLPLVNKNYMTEDLKTYGTSLRIKEQLYSASSTNIVGNICCNSLSIELVSKDKLLISSNEKSPYFGMMDDTAMVEVQGWVIDEDLPVYFGRYFVDAWENGTTSNDNNSVSISCVDILSKVKNISLGKIRLKRNLDIKNYLKIIVDSLNSKLETNKQIMYKEDDLDIFRNMEYSWQIYYNNIERTDIETMFNNIAQNTISYLWIDRSGYLKTDNLLDDKITESVCNLSGSLNLFEYGSQSGDIDKYSGVEVTYISSIAYEDKQLLQIKDYELFKGETFINNATLNSNKVVNIHHIEIECEQGTAICTSFDYYKDNIDMIIESTNKTKATITVFGSIINETTDKLTMYKDNNNKSNIIEINNNILRKEMINTYTTGLVQLMSMKDNKLYAEGYINPRIKLADMVYVKGTRLEVNGYYKVIGLEFTLGTNYRCKATLLKTINIVPDADSILYQQNDLLRDRLSGLDVQPSQFSNISAENDIVCESQLVDELTELRSILTGEG